MKRWIFFLLALATALMAAPSAETDVSNLHPVEVLYIYKETEADIVIETDTGDFGKGANLQEALEDLKESAPGEIFLETAAYVLVTEETKVLLPELMKILRPATEIVVTKGNVDVKTAGNYLTVHRPKVTLQDYRSGESRLPELTMTEGRFYLVREANYR